MLFRDKAPGLLCLKAFEQLDANTVHLSGMAKPLFFLSPLLEWNASCMEVIMTGFAECQQIRFLIAPVLAAKNNVVDFYSLVFRLPFALLAGVVISCEHIGACVGKTVVDALLVEPLVLQDFWVVQCMRVKGSRFQHDRGDRQKRLHKA